MELRRVFEKAIQEAFSNLAVDVALTPCQQAKFGDYQCNNAMAIFAELKKRGGEGVAKNPRAVAEAIVANLEDGASGMLACKPTCVCHLYSELKTVASAVVSFFMVT
jgi:arginyl-tRNA synthetase